jgi:hypothetical protein
MKNQFTSRPLGFPLTNSLTIPLQDYSSESLTTQKPPQLLLFNRAPSPLETVPVERKKGGAAYQRRGRSGEGRG